MILRRDSRGDPAYLLRVGDTTHPTPAYLTSDLALRRRAHPRLSITKVDVTPAQQGTFGGAYTWAAGVTLDIANDGLLHAESLQWGLVCLHNGPQQRISEQITGYVEPIRPASHPHLVLRHVSGHAHHSISRLPPLASAAATFVELVTMPPAGIARVCSFAVYLLSRDAPPSWFRVRAEYGSSYMQKPSATFARSFGSRVPLSWT